MSLAAVAVEFKFFSLHLYSCCCSCRSVCCLDGGVAFALSSESGNESSSGMSCFGSSSFRMKVCISTLGELRLCTTSVGISRALLELEMETLSGLACRAGSVRLQFHVIGVRTV